MIFFIAFTAFVQNAFAQAKESVYPKILLSPNDTFTVRFSNYPDVYPARISEEDSTDMGTDGETGLYAMIKYGKDSLKITYNNLPYAQVLYIPFKSPKGKTVYRLHFNAITASFSGEYIKKHEGTTSVEIPEVYELANIIWTLSPTGLKNKGLVHSGAYYDKIITYFKPYMNHPIFKKLDFPDSVYYDQYYSFRENSYMYSFGKDINSTKLTNSSPYYYVMGDDWDGYTSVFRDLLPMVEDLAKKSNYRKFYKENAAYYTQLVKRETELMPVRKMWDWLETNFPQSKFNSYKVVFSPLITGTHSTQQYAGYYNDKLFREAIMFVCGPETYDQMPYPEKQKEGLMSGIVFTEIDHNYVNSVSYNYKKKIDNIFSDRVFWTANGKADGYRSELSVFNEYMTHAMFCLYILDTYDKETASLVVEKRETMMVENRGFIKFREFNKALIALHEQHKDKKAVELYPEILEWSASFK